MVLPSYPTSRRGIDFRVPRAGCACTCTRASPLECRQWTSPNRVPSPRTLRPAPRREWRGPSLAPFVVARAWMDFDGRTRGHVCTRTRTYTRTQRRLHTQLDSLMTRRIQESNSDDGPGWCAQPHAAAPRRNCTPTDATRRGRISMRAVTSIHAANYYRKRRNRTRPGNWPPRLDLYSTFRSQGTLRGGSFYRVSRSPAPRPPSRDLFLAKNSLRVDCIEILLRSRSIRSHNLFIWRK